MSVAPAGPSAVRESSAALNADGSNLKVSAPIALVPLFEAMAKFILGDHMAGLTCEPPIGKPGYARLLTPDRKPYLTSSRNSGAIAPDVGRWSGSPASRTY